MIKVSMLSESFRDALQSANPAIQPKGVMPMLSSYLVEADRNEVQVTAMNLMLGIRMRIGATVEQGGRGVFNGPTLSDWVSKIPAGEMSIKQESADAGSPAVFQAGRAILTTNHLDPNDYPVFPGWGEANQLASVPAEYLAQMLKSGTISCAVESAMTSRPVLEGVLIRFAPGKMAVAAADGFRMTYLERSLDLPVEEPRDFIVPRKAALALVRLIEAHQPTMVDLAVAPNRSQLMARFGPVEWVGAMIDGAFPDVQQLIPRPTEETHHRIVLGADDLARGIAPLVGLSRQNNDVIQVEIKDPPDELTPGSLRIMAVSDERGSGENYIDASITLSPSSDREFWVSWPFLADLLQDLKGQDIELTVGGRNVALLFRPATQDGENTHAHVVMPMVKKD